MTFDLFGNFTPAKTLEEEYKEYINSSAWKKLRKAKLEEVGYICQMCKKSRYSVRLEVHHLDYKNFKRERLSDLQVVCSDCHVKADDLRRVKVKQKWEGSALVKGFENWMDNGNNGNWRKWSDGRIESEWKTFVYHIGYKNAHYRRSSQW